jgi:hypothetical protein
MATTHPEDQGAYVPVEEVERIDEPVSMLMRFKYRARFVIVAKCSHGGGRSAWSKGRVQEARSEPILVPHWWSDRHEADAVRTLVFFGREERPGHRLVTAIG